MKPVLKNLNSTALISNRNVRQIADGIRLRVLEYTLANNGGYLCQACSSAEILATLYTRLMNLGPLDNPLLPGHFPGVPSNTNRVTLQGYLFNGPHAPHLDRFYLSPTHYSLVLYATLVETGRMAEDGLLEFNKDGGSVEMIGAEHSPGMEVMTGSLGQGISQAAGIALARKLHKETGKNWIFMSDGELQPGQVWEAVQSMVFYKLGNIVIVVDVNGHQCDGTTASVMGIEPLEKRFDAFGCIVQRVNGHDSDALYRACRVPHKNRPLVVIGDTKPWQGIEILKSRAPKFHYIRFKDAVERKKFEDVLKQMKTGLNK